MPDPRPTLTDRLTAAHPAFLAALRTRMPDIFAQQGDAGPSPEEVVQRAEEAGRAGQLAAELDYLEAIRGFVLDA